MNDQMPGTEGYAENAARLAVQYETLTFEQAAGPFLALIPASSAIILDVGAGTGRDAAALVRRGHRVTAVEPVAEFRAIGQSIHAGVDINWIDDALPELASIAGLGLQFDIVMLQAVWMHFEPEQRSRAMATLSRLLSPSSALLISYRNGPAIYGRRLFPVDAAETRAAASRHGLRPTLHEVRSDALGRPDIEWTYLAFARDPSS